MKASRRTELPAINARAAKNTYLEAFAYTEKQSRQIDFDIIKTIFFNAAAIDFQLTSLGVLSQSRTRNLINFAVAFANQLIRSRAASSTQRFAVRNFQ